MKMLVSIATHNGRVQLDRLLTSMQKYSSEWNYDLILVDTQSEEKNYYYEYLQAKSSEFFKNTNIKTMIAQTPERTYDTGAILYVYENYEEYDSFLFLQDSVEVKEVGWLKEFMQKVNDRNVCSWLQFPFCWDSQEQEAYINKHIGKECDIEWAIFGPIFACYRSSLNELKEKNILPVPPFTRIEAQGWERGWVIAFTLAHFPINTLGRGGTTSEELLNYPCLNKYIYCRE